MAGGARLVTGWVVCLLDMAGGAVGIYGEGRHDAPGKPARGASDWLGGVCSATRFRRADAQPIVVKVCLGESDGGVQVGGG